jgi:hypothetical protein
MTVRIVPGAGHTVFRDAHGAFMDLVNDWLARHAPASRTRVARPGKREKAPAA